MKRKLSFGCLIAALLPAPAQAAPKAPIVLEPSSKWEMRYDEDSCMLARQFGDGPDNVTLAITRYAPGDGFEMKLFSPSLNHDGGIVLPINVAFGTKAATRYDGLYGTAATAAKTPMVILSGVRLDGWQFRSKGRGQPPAIAPEQESSVSSITFSAPRKQPIQLRTGSMAAPMKAMRACTDDLLRHWGYDPAVQASLTRPAQPIGIPGGWLRPDDYPKNAIMKGENGLVQIRLDVEGDGSVSKCKVIYRTNPDSFADLTCKLLQARARFSPALDAAGWPVKSLYLSQIRWMAWSGW